MDIGQGVRGRVNRSPGCTRRNAASHVGTRTHTQTHIHHTHTHTYTNMLMLMIRQAKVQVHTHTQFAIDPISEPNT